jgi:diguanylate cyclase (GGDEF)-like protein
VFETITTRRVRARSRERVLLAAVEGQQHVLGLRMIADVLEGAGFEVLFLGSDVPVDALLDSVAKHQPAVVGLGFGIVADVGRLADSLWAIHQLAPETRIMLGGRAVPPGLRDAGYAFVADSMMVVEVIDGLLAGPAQPVPEAVDLMRSDFHEHLGPRERAVETDALAQNLARVADDAMEIARGHVRRAETYRALAFRDPLTDMANRRALDDELRRLTLEPGATGALLMIDVDDFKRVNDEQGHEGGDRLLRTIGLAISASIRPSDLAARFGGDEFAVLLPGADLAVAAMIGNRIRAAVTAEAAPVRVSVGAAELAGDPRSALLAADTALYEAKSAGRDQVVCASAPLAAAPQAG